MVVMKLCYCEWFVLCHLLLAAVVASKNHCTVTKRSFFILFFCFGTLMSKHRSAFESCFGIAFMFFSI
ncbi:hypothetical protein ACB092_11G184300 [Castanea dentata]